MILQPILPGITDHGQLDGNDHDDHVDYHRIDSNRGLDGKKTYVGPNSYFIEVGGVLKIFVDSVEEGSWP